MACSITEFSSEMNSPSPRRISSRKVTSELVQRVLISRLFRVAPIAFGTLMTEIGLFEKLCSGAVAGVIGTAVLGCNLDKSPPLVDYKGKPLSPPFTFSVKCFRDVLAKEGPRGLYKGLSANLIGVTPEKAIKLAVNDYSRAHFALRAGTCPEKLPVQYGMASGAIAGFCQVIATNPMEITKIQMQLAARGQGNAKLLDVVKRLGLRGLYRGTLATLCRDVPFSIMFFQTFASLKGLLSQGSNQSTPPLTAILLSGLLAGGVSAFGATPMDGKHCELFDLVVVKTRLQASTCPPGDTMLRIYRQEGYRGFFRGAIQRTMVFAPLFTISLLVFEVQNFYMNKYSRP
ncbi:Mitochondrial substrate/solute carrier domain-containing protein [Paramicrosporidium saccamoebae]|uniref:Mitochondrial substrate/solute carrier domain-containing protein n=1 Tax=Paramicrosporidium saccamoebae TaxID=1246581 RepID=A0A2H9TLP2_9FUNG|nr:Mitochondrial substrate/solute carrier domain-containing protein [Paramicrosporidium saccamoebae]